MSKYKPAIFNPTVRPSWGGILSYIPIEEKASILEAIIKYPNKECNSAFWVETIEPDLNLQYNQFISTCLAKGRGAKDYWNKQDKDKICLPPVKDTDFC